MDLYRTWLSGLKRALYSNEDQTIASTINIMSSIYNGIPESVLGSTFIGQPGLMQLLLDLRKGLWTGQNTHALKSALSDRIQKWEKLQSLPLLSSPSSPGGSYVDLATRQSGMSRYNGGDGLYEIGAPDLSPTKEAEEICLLGEEFGPPCEHGFNCETKCIEVVKRGFAKRSQSPLVFQADGTAVQNKNMDRDLVVKVNNADLPNVKMEWWRHDDKWPVSQDTDWKFAVDKKLQIIIDFLSRSVSAAGTLKTVAATPDFDGDTSSS